MSSKKISFYRVKYFVVMRKTVGRNIFGRVLIWGCRSISCELYFVNVVASLLLLLLLLFYIDVVVVVLHRYKIAFSLAFSIPFLIEKSLETI